MLLFLLLIILSGLNYPLVLAVALIIIHKAPLLLILT